MKKFHDEEGGDLELGARGEGKKEGRKRGGGGMSHERENRRRVCVCV